MSALRTLAPGDGTGPALVLDAPLSFWGGLDPDTGEIRDPHHPQHGAVVTGAVLVMASGRGSSSSSSVLAEAIRRGTGPAAIVLGEPDAIVALGAIVAGELYGVHVPVVAGACSARTDDHLTVHAPSGGPATLSPTPPGS